MPDCPLVLIVEDDPEVRLLLIRVVEHYGYRVAGANESQVGAEILRSAHPDLLIANVSLRGGNGNDLAKLAYAMDIPVLLISGESRAMHKHLGEDVPFLQKPFRISQLQKKIKELLGKRGQGAAGWR